MLLLWFADDIVLLGETVPLLQLQLDTLGTFCGANSLTVNLGKSKVMAMLGATMETPLLY